MAKENQWIGIAPTEGRVKGMGKSWLGKQWTGNVETEERIEGHGENSGLAKFKMMKGLRIL